MLDFTRRQLRFDNASPPQAMEWFHDVYRREVVQVEIEPHASQRFLFESAVRSLPGLVVTRTTLSPMVARRKRQVTSDDALMLTSVIAGNASLMSAGHNLNLTPGVSTFARHDSEDAAAGLGMPEGGQLLALRLSRRLLEPLVPDYERLRRRIVPARTEAVRLLVHYLAMLEQEQAITSPETARLVTNHVYDLAALAIGTSRERVEMAARGLAAARLAAIKSYIHDNLRVSGLSAATAAAAQDVTPRYVHMLFESEGTTFSEYVVGQRLMQVHRRLTDPRFEAQSISELALQAGFSDLSYFNRASVAVSE
jgi:AraC-like DNA-binding protein